MSSPAYWRAKLERQLPFIAIKRQRDQASTIDACLLFFNFSDAEIFFPVLLVLDKHRIRLGGRGNQNFAAFIQPLRVLTTASGVGLGRIKAHHTGMSIPFTPPSAMVEISGMEEILL